MTFLTIAAKNYLAFARVLFASIARVHPESRRVLLLVDEVEGRFDPEQEDFEVVQSSALGIEGIEWLRFKYSILELSTALKPFAIEWLFARGEDEVVYVDPDIRFYAPIEIPAGASTALTPHLLDRIDDGLRPDELDILRSGVFNLGFAAFRRSAAPLLAWWRERVRTQGWVDHNAGLFVDQKWMDLAPELFDGVAIVRDPRWNVAYWNVWQRPEVAPAFFHFSGFDPENIEPFARHQNRVRFSTLAPEMQSRAREYAAELIGAGFAECRQWPYSWGTFTDGSAIGPLERLAWRQGPRRFEAIADPFGGESRAKVIEHWSEQGRLGRHLWETQPGWRERWPHPHGADALVFRRWLATAGGAEAGLTPALRDVARAAVATNVREAVAAYLGGRIGELELLEWIGESRADLAPISSDRTAMLTWLLASGAAEVGLPADVLSPFRALWEAAIGNEPLRGAKRRLQLLGTKIRASVST